jgi:hypothetical protein
LNNAFETIKKHTWITISHHPYGGRSDETKSPIYDPVREKLVDEFEIVWLR